MGFLITHNIVYSIRYNPIYKFQVRYIPLLSHHYPTIVPNNIHSYPYYTILNHINVVKPLTNHPNFYHK